MAEIPFKARAKVLDVACGLGGLGKTFSNNVYGIDLNPQAVRMARKNGIQAKVGDIEKKWPYPDNFFDIVIASHIIEHVVNPDKLITESKRVLKKGGLLIVLTPNLAAWFNRALLLFGYQPFFTEVSTIDKTLGLKFTRAITPMRNTLGHLRLFTAGALKDLVELHGVTVVKMTGVEFVALPQPIRLLDKCIQHITTLASIVAIVGRK